MNWSIKSLTKRFGKISRNIPSLSPITNALLVAQRLKKITFSTSFSGRDVQLLGGVK